MDLVRRNWAVLSVLVIITACSWAQNTAVVTLSSGPVQGVVVTSAANNKVVMNVFKGIPYAQPPIGALRFLAPVPVTSWTQTRVLTAADPSPCPQRASSAGGMLSTSNEDCLYINVYSPQAQSSASTTKLPVMVWIHGGALEVGSGASAAPDYFIEQNVIFVSFNYRLGALGFLNLNTPSVPGNAGLKDQRLALQWVQKEIGNFGGDISKVTIFGESAGSTSVSFHYISPNSRGLFARAICESGNSFSETTFLKTGFLERAATFAGLLNCNDSSSNFNLTCLQAVNTSSIVSNQQIPLSDVYVIPGNTIRFPATPETAVNGTEPVLTDTPQKMLAAIVNANLTRVPLMLGVNQDEGTLEVTSNTAFYSELITKLRYFIPPEILASKSDAEITRNAASIYQEYFNGIPPNLTNLDGYIKLYGDKMFKVSTANFSRQVASFGNVYLYHFSYSGGFAPKSSDFNLTGKVGHGDELNYLFYNSAAGQATASADSPDKIMLNKMVKMWTNFAYNSDPTPDSATGNTVLGTLKWMPMSRGNYSFLHIVSDIKMDFSNFYDHEFNFWSDINAITSFGLRTTYSVVLLLAVLVLGKIL